MKAKYITRAAATALVLVLVAFLCYEWHTWKSTREIRRFQAEFGLTLPTDSRIVYSEKELAWDGGGELLYVYQLNDEAISALVQQGEQNGWSALPFPMEQVTLLQNKINVAAGALAHNLPYALTKGLGIAIDRPHVQGRMSAADYSPYTNFTIGLVDPDTNRVYCYAYDS